MPKNVFCLYVGTSKSFQSYASQKWSFWENAYVIFKSPLPPIHIWCSTLLTNPDVGALNLLVRLGQAHVPSIGFRTGLIGNSNRPNIKVYNIEDMDLDLTWPAHFWRPPVPLSPFFKMAEKVGILDLISNFKIWTSQFNKFHLD